MSMEKCYAVKKRTGVSTIDADWDKSFWGQIAAAPISVSQWTAGSSEKLPQSEVKLQYDDGFLYLIFRVRDYCLKAVTAETHGPVYRDSCVEFFFAPNRRNPQDYFNFEINCCGVLLAQHHTGPRENSRFLDVTDCRAIRIAASAVGPIRQEITKPVTWTVEYALPLDTLSRYTAVEKPAAGVEWRGNFYKCADGCSAPHWISWSPVRSETPDFHRPESFGKLIFVE